MSPTPAEPVSCGFESMAAARNTSGPVSGNAYSGCFPGEGPEKMSSLSPSAHLTAVASLVSARLDCSSQAFWSHPRLAEVFPEYLIRLHCAARANIPLMEAGLERARLLASDCAVAARLVPYLVRHIREERNHDEWLLQDAAVLGVSRKAAFARTPPGEAATLIGALYYWVFHAHPVTLLSYFFIAEGKPFTVEFLDEVVARTGLPKEALRTFYQHAVLDVKHGEDVIELLDELPLTPAHLSLLRMSTLTVMEHMSEFMERLLRFADRMEETSPALTVTAG